MSVSRVSVYLKDSKPQGITFEEWSARWWQWLLSIPKSYSPVMDFTGQFAAMAQPYSNVFFLCQTIEGVPVQPIRKISIKRGNCIFMPILNWISNFYEHGSTEQELIGIAKQKMDVIGNIDVTSNGEKINGLKDYRFASTFFQVDLPRDNILDLPSGEARFVSDGYWLFTLPIYHDVEISTYASCSSGATKIGVKYLNYNNLKIF